MRNPKITKNRTSVSLLLVLVASIIGLAPAFSTGALAYNIHDVSGTYIDLGDGWFAHGSDTPFRVAGFVTFTAATGTFHMDSIYRFDRDSLPYLVDGTYTVGVDGHGTMTWFNGDKHRDFYIVNGGAELKWINTDPNGTGVLTSSGTMTKQ